MTTLLVLWLLASNELELSCFTVVCPIHEDAMVDIAKTERVFGQLFVLWRHPRHEFWMGPCHMVSKELRA